MRLLVFHYGGITCTMFYPDFQKHLSTAFIPVMRAMWPGINGNHGGSTFMVSNMRKRAVQASRFMLQMMQSKFYQKETDNQVNNLPEESGGSVENIDEVESREEGFAIRIAVEVLLVILSFTW